MKKDSNNRLIVISFALLIFVSGCRKGAPFLTTDPVKNITATTAETGGKITSNGRSSITSFGICWDTIVNPTTAGLKTADTSAKEQFVTRISGLFPNKTYYVRAYAINGVGTGYGEQLSFATPASTPILKTSDIYDISVNTATSGGVVLSNGGSAVIDLGVCWDTVANPTTSCSKTIDSAGNREFESYIHGLKPNKSYYVRAYATNSLGTAYGEEKVFKTTKIPPLITTVTITDRFLYSASCSVTVNSDGGSKIIEYGVCWNTKPDPTTSNFKTNKQYAPGKFRMRDLQAGTIYYARSYAINSEGTGYGKTKSWRTLGSPPKVRTLAASNLTSTAAVVSAAVNFGYLSTQTSFDYGTTEKYGQSTKISKNPYKGKTDTTISVQLSDLKPGTRYHFRVKATNSLGTTYGKDSTFLILMIPNITGFSPITKNYHDTQFFITPPSSNSQGKFTFSSSNPKVAVIEGNKGIITGSGTSIITATQAQYGIFATGSVSTTFSMNLVDIDGNVYHTVAIGGQDWMKENLKVTRFRNGAPIPNVTDNEMWTSLTEGAFCRIKNDTLKLNPAYGAIYNWYAAVDPRKICPAGWHVPTDAEWQVMERYLGMTFAEAEGTVSRGLNYGVQLKDSVGWIKKGNGTNSSEFSALPAGLRWGSTGLFYNTGIDGCWWTSTEEDTYKAWLRNIFYSFNGIYRITDLKTFGFSVRCVRDKK
jgi:uncharacterized protein (TIGR02145 family)